MAQFIELSSVLTGLLPSQKLAVLSVLRKGHPYSCLVSFAETEELKYLLFVTKRNTNKFHDISINPMVAMLIDNRTNFESDIQYAIAVTAIGKANEVTGKQKEQLGAVYLGKHKNLNEFLFSPDSALIKITVEEYVISRFQDVRKLRLVP